MKPFKLEKLIEVQVSDGPVYLAWLRDYEYLHNGNFTLASIRKGFNLILNQESRHQIPTLSATDRRITWKTYLSICYSRFPTSSFERNTGENFVPNLNLMAISFSAKIDFTKRSKNLAIVKIDHFQGDFLGINQNSGRKYCIGLFIISMINSCPFHYNKLHFSLRHMDQQLDWLCNRWQSSQFQSVLLNKQFVL